eukprot:CAMPEP_0170074622 /NCGR_PEP_ID=MMETSP0019_2-20121128/11895_1 /TAXON_ID=98059 /ORGANISM="Dinobryon sp., Strain UTEXLB2267" /LENGTH=109 /DNA_ID=CAMNT_0010285047 /DNA_START=597 /DNA_END=923 /DNA_ORIENTATION=-
MTAAGGMEHQILEMPSLYCGNVEGGNDNVGKIFMTKMKRSGIEFFAEGLVFVLNTIHNEVFSTNKKLDNNLFEEEIHTSKFVFLDPINIEEGIHIRTKDLQILFSPNEW